MFAGPMVVATDKALVYIGLAQTRSFRWIIAAGTDSIGIY
jgi:hypothetical protein